MHLDTPQAPPTGDTSQSTTDMFFDMFTKKGKFLSKLTSFDSEVERKFPASSIFQTTQMILLILIYFKLEFQIDWLFYIIGTIIPQGHDVETSNMPPKTQARRVILFFFNFFNVYAIGLTASLVWFLLQPVTKKQTNNKCSTLDCNVQCTRVMCFLEWAGWWNGKQRSFIHRRR